MTDYNRTASGESHRYETTHQNDERTAVVVTPAFDGWVVLAVDLPANGFDALAETVVAVCATEKEADKRAKAWCEEHPKGVSPGGMSDLKELLG